MARQTKKFLTLFVCFIIAVFLFTGCGGAKKEAIENQDGKLTDTPFKSQEYIEYGDARYNLKLQHPAYMISETADQVSRLVLTFPESYTTGTNLGTAQIRLDINKRTCEDFMSGEDPVIGWHYAKTLAPTHAFPEKMKINGVEFKRLKCSDAAMSHVADSLVYITERSGTAYSLNLYFVSANPEVYDESIRPKTYEPADMEKIYLDILSTFKFFE